MEVTLKQQKKGVYCQTPFNYLKSEITTDITHIAIGMSPRYICMIPSEIRRKLYILTQLPLHPCNEGLFSIRTIIITQISIHLLVQLRITINRETIHIVSVIMFGIPNTIIFST